MSSSTPSRALPATGPLARHGRLRTTTPVRSVFTAILVTLAVLFASTLSIAAIAVYNVASSVAPGVALAGDDPAAPSIGAIEGDANLLLLGSDSGGGDASFGEREGERNDVTMLLHIAEDHQSATVVSFPRDLFVDVPECISPDGERFPPATDQKLNTTLARGGLACPVSTIAEMTGLEIPFAAKIEFPGVIAMSNAVGGVEVCVATPIRDRQINFSLDAGRTTLQGRDAFLFLQSRYGVSGGTDTARIGNQQQFLSSLVRKLKDAETLSNPVTLYGIATAATQNLEFSNSLRNVDTMVSIAAALKDIPLEKVLFVKYPGTEGSSGGQSGIIPDEDAAETLFAAIAADQPLTLTGGTGEGTTIDPAAPPVDPAAPVDPSAAPDPSAGADPSADPSAPAPDAPVALPDTIEGQNASQQTCTNGQTAGGND